eukprot:617617-Pelagomonas_calceolata.AAC.1
MQALPARCQQRAVLQRCKSRMQKRVLRVDASRRAMLSTLPMLFTLPGSEVPPPKIGGDCAD